MKAYAIKDELGDIHMTSLWWNEEECQANFIKKHSFSLGMNKWEEYLRVGFRCVPVSITEESEIIYTLQNIIDAVKYGFDYRDISQNNGKNVPNGNVLQWLMSKKNLIHVPEEFEKYKLTDIKPNDKKA